jgi:quinol monooxygenase YgiN
MRCVRRWYGDTAVLLIRRLTKHKPGGIVMSEYLRVLSVAALFAGAVAPVADADERGDARSPGPIYNVVHFDVIPATIGGVDFLQNGYALLFKYRDQSKADAGLQSFRILNLIPPTTNHSEIVQVFSNYKAYENHLAQADTVGFRFDVQNNPALNGCCIGSPIDDRQYRLVRSFNAPWSSASIPSTVGPSGLLYVVTYVELLQEGNVALGQEELIDYGAATSKANGSRVLSYSILQQLDRPNRFAVLEIWDSQASYNTWQGLATTTDFIAKIEPLLGSPFDHRLTVLCGETYSDSAGCTPP